MKEEHVFYILSSSFRFLHAINKYLFWNSALYNNAFNWNFLFSYYKNIGTLNPKPEFILFCIVTLRDFNLNSNNTVQYAQTV